jgi:hypothetical protein
VIDRCFIAGKAMGSSVAYLPFFEGVMRHQKKRDRSDSFVCVLGATGYCVDDLRRLVVV